MYCEVPGVRIPLSPPRGCKSYDLQPLFFVPLGEGSQVDEPILLLFVLLRKEESYEYQRMESKMGIGRDPSYRDCCHGFVDAFLKIIGPIQ